VGGDEKKAAHTADHTPAAPPSLLPAKKYCDITGLQSAYTDPRSKLRYKGLEVWHVVRNLVSYRMQLY
jgi:INO80 complex subunit C